MKKITMTICGMTIMGVVAFAQSNTTNPPSGTSPNETNNALNKGTNTNVKGNVTPSEQLQGGPQQQNNPSVEPSQQSAYPSQTQPMGQPDVQSSEPNPTLTQPTLPQSQPTPAVQGQPQPLTPTGGGQPQMTTPGTQLQRNQSTTNPTNSPTNSSTPQTGSQNPPR
ncbi:MAG: hypothetical protein WKF87_02725 [Chryseolinea sp.]